MTPTPQDAGQALLPCPFCGGEAGKPSIGGNPGDERSGYNYKVTVMCSACGAAKTVYSKRGKNGWCDENTEDAIQRAAAAWNTRPPADRLEAMSQGWRPIESAPKDRPFWARKSNNEIALCWRHNPSSRTDEVVTWTGNQGFRAVEWRFPDPLPPDPQPDA
jgi:hypothetical protein